MIGGKLTLLFFIGIAYDFGIAVLFGLAIGWQGFFVFLAFLYGARLALSLYGILRLVLNFYLFRGKESLKRVYIDLLQASGLPKHRNLNETGTGYLARIRGDKNTPVNARLHAAELQGAFDSMRASEPVATLFKLLAFESALSEYAVVDPIDMEEELEFALEEELDIEEEENNH